MLGVVGNTGTRDVDVNATVILVRPEQLDRQVRIGCFQATEVVAVDDTDIALPATTLTAGKSLALVLAGA